MGHSPAEMGHSPAEMGHSPAEMKGVWISKHAQHSRLGSNPDIKYGGDVIDETAQKSAMKMDHDSPAKKIGDPETDQSKQLADIKSSVKSFGDKIGQKAKPDFKSSSTKDLVVTDPVVKKYDGYDPNSRTLIGRQGTNTTASGGTVFPEYSSKSIGTYQKDYKTYNKIRPGLEARSFGDYAKMEKEQKSRKIGGGIDPIKRSDITSGTSRQPGTFKTYLNTGDEKTLNLATNMFGTKKTQRAIAKLDSYLQNKMDRE